MKLFIRNSFIDIFLMFHFLVDDLLHETLFCLTGDVLYLQDGDGHLDSAPIEGELHSIRQEVLKDLNVPRTVPKDAGKDGQLIII